MFRNVVFKRMLGQSFTTYVCYQRACVSVALIDCAFPFPTVAVTPVLGSCLFQYLLSAEKQPLLSTYTEHIL